MLLIVTYTQDFTVDYVVNILNKKRIPFFRLNTDLLDNIEYNVSINGMYDLNIENYCQFSSLWFRRVRLPNFSNFKPEIANYLALDYESLLFNIVNSYEFKRVLSDPYNIYQAENKFYQLKLAKEIGFKVPKTLITSSKSELKDFIGAIPSIIKPIRSGHISLEKNYLIYTNQITISDIEDSDILSPAIYQEEIKKEFEVRVTVIDNSVFAAKVNSQNNDNTKTDWRRSRLNFEIFDLPREIQKICVELVMRLNLKFGAIDLIYTPEGDYYFLEINPNGQWVWIELDTKLPIASALINYLTNE